MESPLTFEDVFLQKSIYVDEYDLYRQCLDRCFHAWLSSRAELEAIIGVESVSNRENRRITKAYLEVTRHKNQFVEDFCRHLQCLDGIDFF